MRTIGEREPDVPRAEAETVSSSCRGSKLRYCLKYLPMFQYLLHKAEARYAERF
jgi:hypothetical protein